MARAIQSTAAPQARVDKSATLDAADLRLIELLTADGRASNRFLAGEVGLTEATVASRIRRLADSGVLTVTAVLDWEVAGYEWYVSAYIEVEGRPPRAVAADIAELTDAHAVTLVFGQFDVMAHFLAEDRQHLHRLLTEQLAAVPGVRQVTTSLATQTVGFRWGVGTFPVEESPDLRLPDPPFALDELDHQVIGALIDDGRQSNREIGRQLGVSDGTIRARLRRLEEAGLLRIVAMVDPVALGTVGAMAFIGITVEGPVVGAIAAKVSEMPEIMHCSITVGRHDILVVAACDSRPALVDLAAHRLRSIDGIRSTETLEAIEVVKHEYHWVRLI